ncbi:hypothetical protein SAMN05444062_101214 [Pseudomonas syringae]|uniref:hypothetical protein n=1 Tax=Pseudomonas syringae TaxID=317 RepID=UPI0008E0555C|nr:hypothetical protein [Pseudomonas syringae]SFG74509.1 hypothetical protein SAMN05444062_101214 [Pseudomonas syringae]
MGNYKHLKRIERATELLVYDADTLSTLAAEIEAKAAAQNKKFKYFDVISIRLLRWLHKKSWTPCTPRDLNREGVAVCPKKHPPHCGIAVQAARHPLGQ